LVKDATKKPFPEGIKKIMKNCYGGVEVERDYVEK
jgi:hypothetical protein